MKNIKELKTKLDTLINDKDIVILVPHKGADCDAIASSLAMKLIMDCYQKESYVLIQEPLEKLDNSVRCIISELQDGIIVNMSQLERLLSNKKSLMITLDVNKSELIPISDYKNFDDILVIDHHDIGESTIDTENLFIDTLSSSASEIMYKLLDCYGLDERMFPNLQNYLLSGISLDTAKFTNKKTTFTTMKIVADLIKKGGDLNYVNDLFIDDYEKDMRYLDLIRYTTWKMYNISISMNNNDPKFIYEKEDLAKAADWMLKYKTTDASFALGLTETDEGIKNVYISGRSKGIIDIGETLSLFGGGGNVEKGAACVQSENVSEVKDRLEKVLVPGYLVKRNI